MNEVSGDTVCSRCEDSEVTHRGRYKGGEWSYYCSHCAMHKTDIMTRYSPEDWEIEELED